MKSLLLASVTALALTAAPTLAAADTFHVDSYSQPAGAQNVTLTLGPLSRTVSAGEINLHQNIPAADLLVWCLDVQDTLFVPYTYNVTNYTAGLNLPGLPAGGLSAAQIRQIGSLMRGGLTVGGLDANQDDAATQLAIWSVEYGNGISFSGLSAPLQGRLALLLLDSAIGGIIDCPTCTLKILSDDIIAPNQAVGTFVDAVPAPVVGAGFPGIVAGCIALWGLAKRRRRQTIHA